jgi:ABC-type dipeptide/oligopeptide/nickel transport system permease subunit
VTVEQGLPSASTRELPGARFWCGATVVVLAVVVAALAPWLAPYPPLRQDLDARLVGPSAGHLLGTDELGRDVLARLIYGARISLAMAFGSMLLAMPIGESLSCHRLLGSRVERYFASATASTFLHLALLDSVPPEFSGGTFARM